jgi:uncharacterized lipoprotein YmbA
MKHKRSLRLKRVFIRSALTRFAIGICVAALAACASSPSSHFYTLGAGNAVNAANAGNARSGPVAASASATMTASAAERLGSPPLLIEVPPVDVPSQVARNQLVVQMGGARVDVLEQERWASPPADEIRRALSGDLAARLDTFDVYGTPRPNGVPVYRVSVSVQRFESWFDSRAVLDAVWSVRAVGKDTVLTCRTLAQVPVGSGYAALVEGHRQAVAQMADQIAAAIKAFGSAGAPPSPANDQCAGSRQTSAKVGGAS